VSLFVLTALLAAACRPELKPHQALRAADDLHRAGKTYEAENAYKVALAKAEKAGFTEERSLNEYVERLVQVCAQRGELLDAEQYFRRLEATGPKDRLVGYATRGAGNLATAHARLGHLAEAEAYLTRAVHSLESGEIQGVDSTGPRLLMWAQMDRIRSADGRREEAAAAFQKSLRILNDLRVQQFHEGHYWPLPSGLRESLERYARFLRESDRGADAATIDEIARGIEEKAEKAGFPYVPSPCITYLEDAPMGCLLEIE
jgi:tetratricopeptide (TPR) repeat protein